MTSASGLATTDQAVPSHDSTSVSNESFESLVSPTATHAVGDVHDTPWREFSTLPGLGLATTDQALPSHDSTRVRCTPLTS